MSSTPKHHTALFLLANWPLCSHPLHFYDLNHTQLLMSFQCSWLSTINRASVQTAKTSLPEMEALQRKKAVSQPVHALEERNSPTSAIQGLSKAELWHGYPPPPVPLSEGHCQKWHREAECLMPFTDGYVWELLTHSLTLSLSYLIVANIKPHGQNHLHFQLSHISSSKWKMNNRDGLGSGITTRW